MAAANRDLAALTAEVAQLAEAVRGMAQREIAVKTIFDAEYQAGQDDMWQPAARPARRRPRACGPLGAAERGHLNVVQGDAMNAALVALMLTLTAPLRLSVTILGTPAQFPAGWLILGAEVLAAAALAWLAVRVLRRFRSSPFPRRAER